MKRIFRVCRCCNQKTPTTTFLWQNGIECEKCSTKKTIERTIRCGLCGEIVDQTNTDRSEGKWFHDNCHRVYKNFCNTLFLKPIKAIDERLDVESFRDFILTQMIMRKDLRMYKEHWELQCRNKLIPIVAWDERYAKLLDIPILSEQLVIEK